MRWTARDKALHDGWNRPLNRLRPAPYGMRNSAPLSLNSSPKRMLFSNYPKNWIQIQPTVPCKAFARSSLVSLLASIMFPTIKWGYGMLQALSNTIQAHNAVFEGRKHERFELAEACEISRWGKKYHAITRNISRGGICLDIIGMGSTTFDAELTIWLRNYKPITAVARWSHKRTFGLKFNDPIETNPEVRALVERLEFS